MSSRIAYLSWPASEITGGIKLTFRHVELLRESGFNAVVVTSDGRPPSWFETTAPVLDPSGLVQGKDVLVFPENHHAMLKALAGWSNRKIVFCQNHFMAFRGLDGRRSYGDFGVSGILAEGEHVVAFCRRRFPDLPAAVVPVMIDGEMFGFQREKQLQIAFTPRKRPMEAAFVRDLFCAQDEAFRSIPWIEISGVPEAEVAEILENSAVYLSLCRFESVGLTVLEAMARGCVVAGFTGFGARQYATAGNGFWAEEDDVIGCTEQLARAVRLVMRGGQPHEEMVDAGRRTAGHYSRERLAKRLAGFWQGYLEEGTFPQDAATRGGPEPYDRSPAS